MSRGQVWRRRIAYGLGVLVALVFLMQGSAKLDPDGFWTAAFARWGYPTWFRYLVGVMEIAGGLALFIPRVASYGAALLMPVMLGAIVTRLRDGVMADAATATLYLVLLLWFAAEWWGSRWRRR